MSDIQSDAILFEFFGIIVFVALLVVCGLRGAKKAAGATVGAFKPKTRGTPGGLLKPRPQPFVEYTYKEPEPPARSSAPEAEQEDQSWRDDGADSDLGDF